MYSAGVCNLTARLFVVAALLLGAGVALPGCTGGAEREAERTEGRVKDDARGVRDFLYDRGITVDTRTSP
jgi:hypothetical protein